MNTRPLTFALAFALTAVAGCDETSDDQLGFYDAVDAQAEHLSDDQLDALYSADVDDSAESSYCEPWASMDTPDRPAYKQCFGGQAIIPGFAIYTGDDHSELDFSFVTPECRADLEPWATVEICPGL